VVSLERGQLRYVTERSSFVDDASTTVALQDALLASASIPVVFPPVALAGEHYVDGGTRENIPLAAAVEAGANYAYVVFPSQLGPGQEASYAGASMLKIAPRALQLVMHETQKDDLEPFRGIGIPVCLIAATATVHDALLVDPGLIAINMAYGYMRAYDCVQPDEAKRAALMASSDQNTTLRTEIWRAEMEAAGERMPDARARSARGDRIQLSRSPEGLEAARAKKWELRAAVHSRIAEAGRSESVPPNPAAWWQGWERHNWSYWHTPSPWDRFTTNVRTVPAAPAPPP
jgi:NTE family protein